ncbi:MAG: hypothetical protein OXR67_08050 [Chloroflexota bacterium]|nr:hypothetical protein [Chloroflexota bacterium]
MTQTQPDFHECASLQEAAKRAQAWAWSRPSLNPGGKPPTDARDEARERVSNAAAEQLTRHLVAGPEGQAWLLTQDREGQERLTRQLGTALEEGYRDWVQESVEIALHQMEQAGEVKRVGDLWQRAEGENDKR